MTDDAYGATIAKRRLSRRLAELRVASGYTANHVCDILNWGRGKVGRFEANQWKRPEMSDIRDLLRIYNADTTVQDELEDLAIRARARPWWREYPEIFGNEFPGFENDASHIRVFMPLILPGLLQTAAYVEAGLRTGPRSPTWRQKALETRLRRQEILSRSQWPAQRRAAHPAVCRRSLSRHAFHDQYPQLSWRGAESRVHGNRLRDRGGEQRGFRQRLRRGLQPRAGRGIRAPRHRGLPQATCRATGVSTQ